MDIRNAIKSRKIRDSVRYALSFLPSNIYLRLYYTAMTGRVLHLKNPKTYNEKLQWLKLHNQRAEYTELSDKIAVREHVEKELGVGYTFPILGVWTSADEIDFSKLPNEFVLKCNHDSGSVRIIRDKSSLTQEEIAEIRRYYKKRLKRNFYYAGREYPYKNIPRKVFAEQLMKPKDPKAISINDYKFFCFNGEPKLLLVVSGRNSGNHFEDYFDMEFNHLPEVKAGWKPSATPPKKPECFEEMKHMARALSKGICQVRMDFYEIDGRPYFGEYTFFSGGGNELFYPEEWEQTMGDWIKLEDVSEKE